MKRVAQPKRRRFLLASIGLACLLGFSFAGAAGAGRSESDSDQPPEQYTGPGSCSSTSCHGSIAPMTINRVMQNEYSIWIVRDKHSKAYNVLTGMVAERMANLLGLGKAETAPRCLACHALDVPASERARTFEINDGVSCESCHGPASAWLGRHTERNWTHEQSLQLGMYDTRDLIKRSQKCLSCHLGSDQKYVDHEMIAAGHPDLYFELDSFSATMPRHWREPGEPGEPPGSDPWYDIREWTTGQAVQLREGLLHLASRARGKIWPEYSEQECYACHHSLVPAEQSWRQARGYSGRQPGNPPWNASRYTVFREIVREMDPANAKELDDQLIHLTALMSALNPNRDEVVSTAASSAGLADAIARKLNASTYDSALTVRIFQRICSDADSISNDGEHSAAQAAMALQSLFVAYNRNEKMQDADEVRAAINGLFDQLQVPSSYDGPRFAYQMRRVSSVWH